MKGVLVVWALALIVGFGTVSYINREVNSMVVRETETCNCDTNHIPNLDNISEMQDLQPAVGASYVQNAGEANLQIAVYHE